MELDYRTLTLEEIEMFEFFYFVCDGDKKKLIVKERRNDYDN